jgi:hypothetical protein
MVVTHVQVERDHRTPAEELIYAVGCGDGPLTIRIRQRDASRIAEECKVISRCDPLSASPKNNVGKGHHRPRRTHKDTVTLAFSVLFHNTLQTCAELAFRRVRTA